MWLRVPHKYLLRFCFQPLKVNRSLKYSDVVDPAAWRAVPAILTDDSSVHDVPQLIEVKCGWLPRVVLGSARAKELIAKVNKLAKIAAAPRFHFPPHRLISRHDMIHGPHGMTWADIASRANDELYIWGLTCLNTVSSKNKSQFVKIVQKTNKLNILMMSEESIKKSSEHMNFGVVCNKSKFDFSPEVKTSMDTIREQLILQFSLMLDGHDLVKKVEIRQTNWSMTWSGVAIDPDSNDGVLQIETYLYQEADLDARPNIILTKASPIYQCYRDSLRALWDGANPVTL
jgi:hypothetical protein